MRATFWLKLALLCSTAWHLNAEGGSAAPKPAGATVADAYTLPRLSLAEFGNPACTAAVLAQAGSNGLKFSDLPSIGSGLARAGTNEFFGITDRGPNGTTAAATDDDAAKRVFPLPQFCPTIVRFKLAGSQIQITEFIPLRDRQGRLISGLSNMEREERLYESAEAKKPLPLDQNGVDPEAIRVLPDGSFLLAEEYSPSLLVISQKGEVLVRYTPASKPLPKATYPVKPILPDSFTQRRRNHGFESVAVSGDGRWTYVFLQSPMGDDHDPHFAGSRVIRALKLDLSRPLDAKVVGEYLVPTSPAKSYSAKQKQEKISFSDADWLAPDQLLVAERAKGEVKLLVVDLAQATNVLGRKEERTLQWEDTRTDLGALGIQVARTRQVFSTRQTPGVEADKIEGLAVLGATDVALSNDNDFGIGDNVTGEPSKLWIVHLAEPLLSGEGR